MSYGIKLARKIQGAFETNASFPTLSGTAAAATSIWRGTGMWEDKRTVTFPPEDIGYISGVDRTYVPMLQASLAMDAIPATFQQLPQIFACSMKDTIAGVQDGSGSDYVYDYPMHFLATSLNTIKTKTWEVGDNHDMAQLTGCFINDFTLSVKPGASWDIAANWIAQQALITDYRAKTISVTKSSKTIADSANGLAPFLLGWKVLFESSAQGNDGIYTVATAGTPSFVATESPAADETAGANIRLSRTFTSTASLPSVSELLFAGTKLYVDPVSGSLGATQFTNDVYGITISVKPGWKPRVPSGDGSLFYTAVRATQPDITVKVIFEYNPDASDELKAWKNQTARMLRIKVEGNAVATAGTTYSKETALFDFIGKWSDFAKVGDNAGIDILEGTFKARYNATAAKLCEFQIINELTAIP